MVGATSICYSESVVVLMLAVLQVHTQWAREEQVGELCLCMLFFNRVFTFIQWHHVIRMGFVLSVLLYLSVGVLCRLLGVLYTVSEWVSSFLTAHQHIVGFQCHEVVVVAVNRKEVCCRTLECVRQLVKVNYFMTCFLSPDSPGLSGDEACVS